MIDLDERLDRAARDLWAVTPADTLATRSPQPSRSTRVVLGTAAAAVVVSAVGAVWVWRDVPADEATTASIPPSAAVTTAAPQTTVVPPTAVTTAVPSTADLPVPGSILTSEAEYVIREGDYPATVATMWGVAFEDLAALNGWTLTGDGIVPEWPGVGATIRIPAGATVPGGPDDAAAIDVFEQQMEVTLSSTLICDEPYTSPGFDTFTLSLFSDRTARRWLMRATFPDLSTYELVATGSVLYPTTLHARGTWRGASTGCVIDGREQYLGALLGEGTISALNLDDELATDERQFFIGDVDPSAVRYGDGRISATGWPGTGWSMVETGTFVADDGVQRAVETTTRWIVSDGTVVERSVENQVDGLGVATVTTSMLGFGGTMVDATAFDTTDARQLTPLERPVVPLDSVDP
jgi:hypothetical protein